MSKQIRIIVCRVGELPSVEMIDDTLEAMQSIVGGHIEHVRLSGSPFGHGLDLWCDDEGLFRAAPNRRIGPELVIHGPFFVAAHEGENMIGLSDAEVSKLLGIINGSWHQVPGENQ